MSRFSKIRALLVGLVVTATCALGLVALPSLANAAVAAPHTSYVKAFNYQFAASSAFVSAHNEFSNAPLDYHDASQTLGADGVDFTVSTTDGADVGVVVPLGTLDSLYNTNGQFVPPVINGVDLEGYNLYFGTDGSGTYLGFPFINDPTNDSVFLDHGSSDTPVAYDGTNKAAMGAINNTDDCADFNSVWSGQSTAVIPNTSETPCAGEDTDSFTMEQVLAFFNNRTDNGTKDPEVWAWIGIGDGQTPGGTGYVTSVDGQNLVNTMPAKTATVPNEIGRHDLATANAAVTSAGLVAADKGNSGVGNLGTVTSQFPAAGTAVVPGSTVSLTYTVPVGTVKAPNEIGRKDLAYAESLITAAGFVPKVAAGSSSGTGNLGSVTAQTPAGGSPAVIGSTITITYTVG